MDFTKAKTIINFVIIETKKETRDKHTTPKYIWRTKGDNKVRSRHEKFDGKIFSWDSLPPGGYHPSEDHNCRCVAEPYKPKVSIKEYTQQILTSVANDAPETWTLDDYSNHYYHGNGQPIRLHEMGILNQIIKQAKFDVYPKMERLIFKKVELKGAGIYPFRWNDSYSFHRSEFALGGATVNLNAIIEVKDMGYSWEIKGDLDYDFYDKFTDPRDLINLPGEDYNPEGSTPFKITDKWSTLLNAVIRKKSGT